MKRSYVWQIMDPTQDKMLQHLRNHFYIKDLDIKVTKWTAHIVKCSPRKLQDTPMNQIQFQKSIEKKLLYILDPYPAATMYLWSKIWPLIIPWQK